VSGTGDEPRPLSPADRAAYGRAGLDELVGYCALWSPQAATGEARQRLIAGQGLPSSADVGSDGAPPPRCEAEPVTADVAGRVGVSARRSSVE